MATDLTQVPPFGHFAEINGFKMYYQIHGAGEPLVLLHGYTDSSQLFRSAIPILAEHYQVIAPDLRGHGRSVDSNQAFTLKQAADDISALMDHLGFERFKGIGCSAGGCMLLYMASERPESVTGLVLESCGHYFSQQTSEALHSWVDLPDSELEPKEHKHLLGIPQLRALLNQLPKLADHYNEFPPAISNILCDTLIVMGDRDELYPLSIALEMHEALPSSYLWIVPNREHTCTFDSPEMFLEAFTHNALKLLNDEWS